VAQGRGAKQQRMRARIAVLVREKDKTDGEGREANAFPPNRKGRGRRMPRKLERTWAKNCPKEGAKGIG